MEEAGRVRRGHFAVGMTSAQLAVPGAVDRLRSWRDAPKQAQAVLLAATDPGQPYGLLLDWPPARDPESRPRRALGAGVVLVNGRPCLFIDRAGKRVLTFPTDRPDAEASLFARGLRTLGRDFSRLGLTQLRITEIDGERARSSVLANEFLRAGFRVGYQCLELNRLGDAIDIVDDDSEAE